MIEENLEEDEEGFEGMQKFACKRLSRLCDSTTSIFSDKSKALRLRLSERTKPRLFIPPPRMPICEEPCREELEEEDYVTNDCDQNQLILEDFENDLLESCKEHPEVQRFFCSMGETADLTPSLDSDEGSLSSGCESASTVTSDLDQNPYIPIPDAQPEAAETPNLGAKKTEAVSPDFKVGECVLARVCSLERLTRLGKVSKHGLSADILEPDEVSLVPVGETQSDFSSLKVFKKRVASTAHENERDFCTYEGDEQEGGSESGSACSDESGYDELLDCNSSVSNIVLV